MQSSFRHVPNLTTTDRFCTQVQVIARNAESNCQKQFWILSNVKDIQTLHKKQNKNF